MCLIGSNVRPPAKLSHVPPGTQEVRMEQRTTQTPAQNKSTCPTNATRGGKSNCCRVFYSTSELVGDSEVVRVAVEISGSEIRLKARRTLNWMTQCAEVGHRFGDPPFYLESPLEIGAVGAGYSNSDRCRDYKVVIIDCCGYRSVPKRVATKAGCVIGLN